MHVDWCRQAEPALAGRKVGQPWQPDPSLRGGREVLPNPFWGP
jgi:hypothetical protein